ncbi:hypothetical protein IJ750_01085 [bacterium]|nr:hypothetical protein [bacterium]
MLKIDPLVKFNYVACVLPKITANKPLSSLDYAVNKAMECAKNDDEKGLKSAMELIGRLMTYRKQV